MGLQPGAHVGRYIIQNEIGEGGFGKVYCAWDPEFARRVAIKELLQDTPALTSSQYAQHLARFKLERQVQGQFQHPHIVSVYDMVQQDDNEYLIEEFVPGGALSNLILRAGKLPPEQVVQIGIELCQAITAAWGRDIVHRDIKPSNILLTEDGHVKLTDFGIAQIGQMSQRTQTGDPHPGTPTYKSPEQEQGYGYLDERSDIYALGLTLYEGLTGSRYKRERVAVRRLHRDVPKRLDAAIMRALAPDPENRYQHAADFAAALQQSLKPPFRRWMLLGGVGLSLLLALAAIWQLRPAALPTETLPPSPTLTATIRATVNATPSAIPPSPTRAPGAATVPPTYTRVPTSTPAPVISGTDTPEATATPRVTAPQLLAPGWGAEGNSARWTLEWRGTLPNTAYGYRVWLTHNGAQHSSALLTENQWTFDLPGAQTWGEWRWSVGIVSKESPQTILAQSEERPFYYNPVGSPLSPLATPAP
ncbi:MAG TPA: protein kinase [Anaerolineae bacterium]|nr:protein kinase [Anaerolineae bacterium]